MAIFDLINSQRYFHVIAFKNENNFFNNSLLKKLNITVEKTFEDISNVEIKQMSIVSSIPFYRGEQDFSLHGDGKAPFKYDMVLINLNKLNISLVCFPFKYLTKIIIKSLVQDYNILSKNNFIKIDLNNFIKSNQDHTDYYGDDITYFFSSINLVLTEESSLSSVKLVGDKPLDSSLYKNIFKDKINDDKCKLEKCVVKSNTSVSEQEVIPKTKSAIHIDSFGNYKIYIHSTGKNIITIPLLFKHINDLNCLIETPINPVNNLKDEE